MHTQSSEDGDRTSALLLTSPGARNDFLLAEINHQLIPKEKSTMFTLKPLYSARIRALAAFVLVVALTIIASTPFAASARAASSPLAMTNLTPEQIEAAVEEYFASVGAFDVPRYVNNFAPDGVLEDPVGTPAVQGTPAIAAYIAAITAAFSEIKDK